MPDTAMLEGALDAARLDFSYQKRGEVRVHLSDGKALSQSTTKELRRAGYELKQIKPQPWGNDVIYKPDGGGSSGGLSL